MDSVNLHQEWLSLLTQYQIEPDRAQPYLRQLLAAYDQAHRHYHNLDHLRAVLHDLRQADVDDAAAYWAAWFHDVVYVPGRSDNEAQSARYAHSVMCSLAIDTAEIARVQRYILATGSHTASAGDDDIAAFLDADMAILAAPCDGYFDYAIALRREFYAIPRFLFNRGRKKFLHGLLAREFIFISPGFRSSREVQARRNVQRELALLS